MGRSGLAGGLAADARQDIHLFPNDAAGHALLRQLQQRAEAWAEAGICNMIFSTDDFCEGETGPAFLRLTPIAGPLDAFKKNASRMRVSYGSKNDDLRLTPSTDSFRLRLASGRGDEDTSATPPRSCRS